MNTFKRNKISLLTAIALIFLSISNFLLLSNKNPQKRYGNKVINVIDGDTIAINEGVLIRLHGINAPDLDYCGGKDAKQKLEELVLNKKISVEAISLVSHDRILALIYIDDTFVNEVLLKEGYAEIGGTAIAHQEQLHQANQYARKNKLGIYGECISEQPPKPGCNIKANIDARDGTKIYHLPNCPNYKTTIVESFRGEKWFCTEKEAQEQGFKRAQNCP